MGFSVCIYLVRVSPRLQGCCSGLRKRHSALHCSRWASSLSLGPRIFFQDTRVPNPAMLGARDPGCSPPNNHRQKHQVKEAARNIPGTWLGNSFSTHNHPAKVGTALMPISQKKKQVQKGPLTQVTELLNGKAEAEPRSVSGKAFTSLIHTVPARGGGSFITCLGL